MSLKNNTCWKKYKDLICLGVCALLFGVVFMCMFRCYDFSEGQVVLGFFGILATFVVVGNYAQGWRKSSARVAER